MLIAAFEGWNDAGDAATAAVGHMALSWGARPFASIDPEEFFDFTLTRPQIRLDDDELRQIHWPSNELLWANPPGSGGVVLLNGI